jgi:hypothetical protein
MELATHLRMDFGWKESRSDPELLKAKKTHLIALRFAKTTLGSF